MKTATWALLFIVTTTATVWGRLGENLDQIVARYGQPLSTIEQKGVGTKLPLVLLTFQKTGFEINVSLSDGISAAETFRKLNGQPLTSEESQALLLDNAEGSQWEAPRVIGEQKKWIRDDGAVAMLSEDRILNLISKDLLSDEAIAKEFHRQPSLDGF